METQNRHQPQKSKNTEPNRRQEFLDNWRGYPSLKKTAWNPRDLKKRLAKVVAGEKPKTMDIILCGRLKIQGEIVSSEIAKSGLTESFPIYILESEGESVGVALAIHDLELAKMDSKSGSYLPTEVLKEGDLVMVETHWDQVRMTGGMSPDLNYVVANRFTLLAPNLKPLRDELYPIKIGKRWQNLNQLIRKCFQFLEFTEVTTPSLVINPGPEPTLNAFETDFKFGSKIEKLYLPTSPELALKKMLAEGWTRIFEIKSVFRNDELTEHHQPEFTMLEWYRAYSNLDQIKKDLQGLLNYIKLHWPQPIRGFSPIQEVTVAELFQEVLGFDLTIKTTASELFLLAKNNGVDTSPTDDFNDLFARIFTEKIEPELVPRGPTLVRNYPPSQAALARLTEEGWADRFELYWKGLEIANAFHELNDPEEQRIRLKKNSEERKNLGKKPYPDDEDFLSALESGVPPSGGIALGVDRLFMALCDLSNISGVKPFPHRIK
jgi:lysyl-tRNA synthetase class 2